MFQSKGVELVAPMRARVRVKVILCVSAKGCGVGRPNEGEG